VNAAARVATVRLLAIDDELGGVVGSGAAAFANRYGLRVHDFAFLVSDVVAPNRALVAKEPRP
jgi:hypothetical protein